MDFKKYERMAELGSCILAQVKPDIDVLKKTLSQLKSKIMDANDRDPYFAVHHILAGIIGGVEDHLEVGTFGHALSLLANDALYDLRLPFPEKRIEENLRISGKLKALHEKLTNICAQEPEALEIIAEYNQRLARGR